MKKDWKTFGAIWLAIVSGVVLVVAFDDSWATTSLGVFCVVLGGVLLAGWIGHTHQDHSRYETLRAIADLGLADVDLNAVVARWVKVRETAEEAFGLAYRARTEELGLEAAEYIQALDARLDDLQRRVTERGVLAELEALRLRVDTLEVRGMALATFRERLRERSPGEGKEEG